MGRWVVPREAWVRGAAPPTPRTSLACSAGGPSTASSPAPGAWGRRSSAPRTAVTWLGPGQALPPPPPGLVLGCLRGVHWSPSGMRGHPSGTKSVRTGLGCSSTPAGGGLAAGAPGRVRGCGGVGWAPAAPPGPGRPGGEGGSGKGRRQARPGEYAGGVVPAAWARSLRGPQQTGPLFPVLRGPLGPLVRPVWSCVSLMGHPPPAWVVVQPSPGPGIPGAGMAGPGVVAGCGSGGSRPDCSCPSSGSCGRDRVTHVGLGPSLCRCGRPLLAVPQRGFLGTLVETDSNL